jgi:hypothetical protein
MVFNATFNNIPVISWLSVLLGRGNRSTQRKQPTCCKLTNLTKTNINCYEAVCDHSRSWSFCLNSLTLFAAKYLNQLVF